MRNESLYRQWQMLHTIYNNRLTGVSKRELAEIYEVSKKTVERDITNLSSVGFPIYDEIDAGRDNQVVYKIVQGYTIPEIKLSEMENYTMYVIFKMVSSWGGYLDGLAKNSFKKIFSQADSNFRNFVKKVSDAIIPTSTNTINFIDNYSQHLIDIIKAIYTYKKIKITYNSVYSASVKTHEISPLSLKFHNNNIYLAGYLKAKKQLLIFALNRIQALEILTSPQDPVNFNSEEFFDSSFGISQGQTFAVKLKFDKSVAQYVSERIWHQNQEMQRDKEDNLILDFQTKSMDETISFVLSFKDNVEVLEPEMLRERVIETLNKALNIYKNKK
ncbi:WYL domain-containing protein [bacterium]|nr:WYL domain-containing protein [bacterium]